MIPKTSVPLIFSILICYFFLFFNSTPAISQELSADTLLLVKYHEEAMKYYIKGDQKSTKTYIEKLSEISYRNNWEDKWVEYMQTLASFELYLGNFAGSRQLQDSLIKMVENGYITDKTNKFKIYNIYSGLLSQEGDINYSEQLIIKAQEILPLLPQKVQNSSLQTLENGKALNYIRYGDYRRAKSSFLYSIVLLHKAFKDGVYEDKGDYEFAKVILYKNVANNDIKAGYFDEAKVYLDSALSTFEGIKHDPYYGNSPMMAALQNTLGEYFMGLGDNEKAQVHMQDRIEELEKYNDRLNLQMRIEARQNAASLYLKSGNYDSARINFEVSKKYTDLLKVSESVKYKYFVPLINFYQITGKYHKADDLLSKIDFEADPIRLFHRGAGVELVSLYALKANSLAIKELEHNGEPSFIFLKYYEKALNLSHQISKLKGVVLEGALKQPTSLAINLYIESLRNIYLQNPEDKASLVKALQVINFAKNHRFNDQKNESSLWTSKPDPTLFADEKLLKRKLAQLEKSYSTTIKEELLDSLVFISNALGEIRTKRFGQHADQNEWRGFDQSIPLEWQGLENGQQELHYFYTDRTLHVFSRSGDDGAWSWKSEGLKDFDTKLIESLTAFQNFSDSSWKHYARQLHKILIQQHIDKDVKRLVIYPFGNLGLVPFAALIDDRGGFLIENYAVSLKNNLPTANAAWSFPKMPDPVLAFAPYFDDKSQAFQRNLHGRLDGTREEVKGISKFFDTRLFEGTQATKASFLNESKSNRLIHLATHAFAEPNVLFSKIIFSGSEKEMEHCLFGYEIPEMELDVDMLVLSACQTGYGKFELGEGVVSLAKLFESSGAKSLIYTLWKVDDFASADLMSLFYEKLDNGLEKDLAMQAAQIAYLKKNAGAKDSPYYWAGFTVSGELSPISAKIPFLWIAIMIMLLGVLLWFARLKYSRFKQG